LKILSALHGARATEGAFGSREFAGRKDSLKSEMYVRKCMVD